MTLEICASKDTVIGAYMKPFYAHNKQDAKRNWGASINYETKKENYDPSIKDLELYSLGTFNDETGEIKPKVEFIANASEFIYVGEKPCFTQKPEDQQE